MVIKMTSRIIKKQKILCLLICFLLAGCGRKAEEVISESVFAVGIETEPNMVIQNPEELIIKKPVKVKGIYVTGAVAGTERMDELIALVEETELNAMVIDIKNDEGVVTYKMQSDTVLEIESGVRYIRDIDELVKKLHEKDIYLIARIVAFKDPYLAEKKPELSLKTKTGAVFRDKNNEAWVNPYKKEVWDYLVEIGTQAAEAGFDEIQFDYIRFSTDVNADTIDYGKEAEEKTKEEVITEFTQYAYETLHPLGVVVSADVFGTIMDNESDREIVGQNYRDMAAHLDYICPMVYPSHYSNGVYNIEVPDKAPYDTVYQAMNISRDKLEQTGGGEAQADDGEAQTNDENEQEAKSKTEEQIAGVRVWIQDFTATWLKDYIPYGAEEVRAQIQAVYDAGYEEWILWNARMNYTKEALLPYWTEKGPQEE
ncbi:MAG: putative glycoside hydrolase [Bacillus sp. (in: Bacteria)]|nr:putative glycoside hydrolase [Bacillus sp. (in: firmicutes)]MCM1426233.1 putative glycoside hydrolase [Eubacterium sp.]